MLATVGMISSFSRNSGPSTPTTANWFFVSAADPMPFSVMAAADDVRVAAEQPLPEAVAEDRRPAACPGLSSSGSSSRP